MNFTIALVALLNRKCSKSSMKLLEFRLTKYVCMCTCPVRGGDCRGFSCCHCVMLLVLVALVLTCAMQCARARQNKTKNMQFDGNVQYENLCHSINQKTKHKNKRIFLASNCMAKFVYICLDKVHF